VTRDIRREVVYPHPIEKVWRAVTDPELLGQWLMPNDFKAEVGHRFTFTTAPGPGFDGVVHCEVLELDAPHLVRISWRGGPIDTVVTMALSEVPGGTRFVMEQTGFEGLKAIAVSFLLQHGMRAMLRDKLPALLTQMNAA
jgi:uncharacterized protein YndB with AHSA1/START domain